MILTAIHAVACVALAVAAIRWRCAHSPPQGAHRFLFPYIVAASVAGILLLAPYPMELFVAWYSGAIYTLAALKFRLTGPYWWAYYAGAILPLLPIFGIIPGIGRRPLLVAGLALLALVPFVFGLLM